MEIITGTTEFYLKRETAVALGKFDGVHIGHRRLLDEILAKKKDGLAACVFTFEPAPAVFFGLSDGKELTTREEKRLLFERMGVDVLIEFPLTKESAAMPPEEFVEEILAKQMNTGFLAAGRDVSFGAGGKGDVTLLERLRIKLAFDLTVIDKVQINGQEVSSTVIRRLVEEGNLKQAEEYLGMPYLLTGTVQHGNRIGRTMGFPTVNIQSADQKLLPPNGVYYSMVCFRGKRYASISNVGCKPTVTEERVMGVESYLYDFQEEIYGQDIEVYLYEFRRPEQRFESLKELKIQLTEDIQAGRDYSMQHVRALG